MTDLAKLSDAVANETSVTSACYSGKINVIQPSHKLHVSSLTASPDTENPKENNSDL
ncbi:hypothetical protein NXC12_CH02982 [Rhizobium etli]|uniref:Uncharacterized protein n=1 Tax=Rhizobium etli TaxID=29449 RepID=A0AAN1EKX8_RHIET|nr:hypothetical protein [Rhizobium etli]ARQ10976.1 hypothetical protein NXC12_CH02982 [Rhizobium etli]